MKRKMITKSGLAVLTLFFVVLLTSISYAYIDPGTLGVIYQVGYLVFYGIIGILIFFFRPIKNLFLKIKEKITGKKASVETETSETKAPETDADETEETQAETVEPETIEPETVKPESDEMETDESEITKPTTDVADEKAGDAHSESAAAKEKNEDTGKDT